MRTLGIMTALSLLGMICGCAATASSAADHQAPARAASADSSATTSAPTTRREAPGSAPVASAPTGDADAVSPLNAFDNFHAITEGRAYRCAQVRPESLEFISRTRKIRTVVNLRGENSGSEWYDVERRACQELGLQLVDIRTSAAALPTPESLLQLYDTIKTAPEPILFHCKAGADRTGMAAAVWRMVQEGDDAKAAGRELSIAFGHFRNVHPEMIELVTLFKADRGWILNEYPRVYAERSAARKGRAAAKADD